MLSVMIINRYHYCISDLRLLQKFSTWKLWQYSHLSKHNDETFRCLHQKISCNFHRNVTPKLLLGFEFRFSIFPFLQPLLVSRWALSDDKIGRVHPSNLSPTCCSKFKYPLKICKLYTRNHKNTLHKQAPQIKMTWQTFYANHE